jgi:hypothetical protein
VATVVCTARHCLACGEQIKVMTGTAASSMSVGCNLPVLECWLVEELLATGSAAVKLAVTQSMQ